MKKYCVFLVLMIMGIINLRAASPSGTLPVLYVNIENGQEVVTKDPYLNAVYWLDPNGVAGIEAFGSEAAPLPTKIKGRGNYTFNGFDKKPYRLKLEKGAALCGMAKSKHFGLLAHADDSQGFLRNTLGFKVSELVGLPWTPKQYPLEVVVNGTYRGLYLLTELIRIDPTRVNITKWIDEDELGNELPKHIEGGTLVELDNYEEAAQIQFRNNGAPEPLRFTYDKSVDAGFEPDGYVDWLKSSLGKVNDLIQNGDPNSDELWQYVDIDDLARFIVVQEFMDNYESFHGSCYLFRELGDGNKWHFSPVWDFGSAFQRSHPSHSFYEQNSGNTHYNHWIGNLLRYPALRAKIAEYWELLKGKRSEIDSYASDFINQIRQAAASDLERWPQYGNSNLDDKLRTVMGYLDSSSSFMSSAYVKAGEQNLYLIGEVNGWGLADDKYKFKTDGDVYTLECPDAIKSGWKINSGSWDAGAVNLGKNDNGNPEADVTYNLKNGGSNITVEIPAGAKLILNYNPAGTSTLLIKTKEDIVTPPTEVSLYLIGEVNGWGLADEKYKFLADGNVYTLNCPDEIKSGWKINSGSWETGAVNLGADSSSQPELNTNYVMKEGGKDITTSVPADSEITLTYNADGTYTLLISHEGGDLPPVIEDYSHTVRFIDAHVSPWEQVYVWIWNGDNSNENFTGGKWPGVLMEKESPKASSVVKANEINTWTHTFDTGKHVPNLKMIFSNGRDDNGKDQTDDLDFSEVYVRGNLISGINAAKADGYTVSAHNGYVTIESETSTTITISDIYGRSHSYDIEPGTTVINLGHGLFIVGSAKVRI